jgi:putative ABC transport system permease protein
MGIPLVQGRYFTERDTKDSLRVVVTNSVLARHYWPAESALDKRIRVPDAGPRGNPPAFTIVGVVGDVRESGPAVAPKPAIYFTHSQFPYQYAAFSVRTAAHPRGMLSSIQKEVLVLDRNQPIIDVMTMDEVVSNSMWQLRFSMALLSVFGVTALVLAASGIYAVMSYSVGQRGHEIGIRMALGSGRGEVLKLVLWNALKLVLGGVAAGSAVAFVLNRGLSAWLTGLGGNTKSVNQWIPDGQRGLLYGLSPTDPLTFCGIAALLVVVALVASYVPARRASRLDPVKVLRTE